LSDYSSFSGISLGILGFVTSPAAPAIILAALEIKWIAKEPGFSPAVSRIPFGQMSR
jgi:hypothetical protein